MSEIRTHSPSTDKEYHQKFGMPLKKCIDIRVSNWVKKQPISPLSYHYLRYTALFGRIPNQTKSQLLVILQLFSQFPISAKAVFTKTKLRHQHLLSVQAVTSRWASFIINQDSPMTFTFWTCLGKIYIETSNMLLSSCNHLCFCIKKFFRSIIFRI